MGRKEGDVIFRECLDSGDVHLRLRLVGVVEGGSGRGERGGDFTLLCVPNSHLFFTSLYCTTTCCSLRLCSGFFDLGQNLYSTFLLVLYVKAYLARCWPPASCNSQYDSKRMMIFNLVVYVHVLYMVGIKRTILVGNKYDLIVITYLTFMRKYDDG